VVGSLLYFKQIIHLIYSDLARECGHFEPGKRFKYQQRRSVVGTIRYISIYAQRSSRQSPGDDLESLGYILIYFINETFKWMKVNAQTVKERYRKVDEIWINTLIEALCTNLPIM
ncbi:hypothetical protein ACOME3_000852, partial [Neoechinorhynchus agilis]